jgi:tetratricopeptide (TPR) repeat protein
METAQESESGQGGAEIDPLTRNRLSGAEEVQASLQAVRSAQAAARARARKETRWARVIAAVGLMAMGVTAWAAVQRTPRARPAVARPKPAVAAAPAVAKPAAPPSIAPPPIEAPPALAQALVPAARPVAATVSEAEGKVAMALCDAAFEQRSWPSIAATCATAFQAQPESGLAMRVAQAQHRRGQVATAADWARKAIALDAGVPEAYVLVARAEVAAGRPGAAAEAYRRYLTLAPRGWHAGEARRAIRAVR